ncbi:tRNA pseudouridine(38-40) synthase TruA [Sporanaerobacter acetigenes]|uniref:tRNA pseudouridine synthase A n=1 Tax=Sporanaerobacter acetigenes DSM 13106 TaxID=1123281 RepID=A0A1M5Z3X0_9FIRM|nr:tRNA pseudouridine(38-40) synthase TruA [Sporanaerobacter acetigenes]SHI18972.1 tRNA pseudouridine38-40 synthase [Sporanaerobacter acetigenes DSM 13106]
MKNIKLTIEYDGTNYFGWQVQPEVSSVQGEIKKAIKILTNEDIDLTGAGRTDRKVHARGQVANFMTNSSIPAEKFSYAINKYLPQDISIVKSEEVDINFHSRYDAIGKEYRYLIYNTHIRSSLLRNYTYHVPYNLDFKKMDIAKDFFLGTHDFSAFMSTGSSIENTVRTIYAVSLCQKNNIICFEVQGNGFLYNMVRIMVGTLIDVGSGKIRPESIPIILESKDRKKAGHTAKPQGLYLEKVYY